MKQYYKIINDEMVFFKNPLLVGNMQVINPSKELLEAAGWIEYIPPEPAPLDYTKYEPDVGAVLDKVKKILKDQIVQQTDEEALENIELFPTWQSKIGTQVEMGERLYFDDKLFKVLQTHTPQEDWRPDITASLYVQVIVESGDIGTIDNPIPYSLNMELIEGKYYVEDGIVYLCTRALAASYWSLRDIVGQYVEVIEI